jgi:hypothetical protein
MGFSGAGGAEVTANSGVGNRGFRLQTNGVDRWRIGADTTAEGGSNAGSDFQIYAFQDGGGPFGPYLKIARSTGRVSLTGSIGVNGAAPPAKPTVTGSKGANAALASLLTALAAYGLVTDSST